MKLFKLNGLKTKGIISFDCLLPIPVRYRYSVTISEYHIGYYKGNRFVLVYTTEDELNVGYLKSNCSESYPEYKTVVLLLTTKVTEL